jgi:biopolymer transport protein ExbD
MMGKFLLAITTVLFLLAVATDAQSKKKRPVRKSIKIQAIAEPLPQREYEIDVMVNSLGVILVGVAPKPMYPAKAEDSFRAFFDDYYDVKDPKIPNAKRKHSKVVVKFLTEVNISTLVDAVRLVRVSDDTAVELEPIDLEPVGSDIRFVVPRKMTDMEMVEVKPNPLALVVEMNEQKGLTLNNEEMGSLSDMTRVTSALRQIFKDRLDNGVFRENSNEIEKTVFIKMPLAAPAADLIKIAKALQEAGADVIGFQVDEPVNERMDIIPGLPTMPGPRKKPIK